MLYELFGNIVEQIKDKEVVSQKAFLFKGAKFKKIEKIENKKNKENKKYKIVFNIECEPDFECNLFEIDEVTKGNAWFHYSKELRNNLKNFVFEKIENEKNNDSNENEGNELDEETKFNNELSKKFEMVNKLEGNEIIENVEKFIGNEPNNGIYLPNKVSDTMKDSGFNTCALSSIINYAKFLKSKNKSLNCLSELFRLMLFNSIITDTIDKYKDKYEVHYMYGDLDIKSEEYSSYKNSFLVFELNNEEGNKNDALGAYTKEGQKLLLMVSNIAQTILE